MKVRRTSVVALFVLSALAASLVAAAPVPPQVRKSADGVELPPLTTPDRKFHVTFPLAGPILGDKPESIGRVFNVKKSQILLAKRTTEDLSCPWYILNVAGADVAGIDLTDGRVTKLVLFYETATALKVTNIRKQVESHPNPAVHVTVKPIPSDKKQALMVTFEADTIEYYLATHTPPAPIAEAMRQHKWLPAMTDEQALLVGDGPGQYAAIFSEAPKGNDLTGTVFADTPTDLRIVIQARNKAEAREKALQRHKNLKDLTKVPTPTPPTDGGKTDAGK